MGFWLMKGRKKIHPKINLLLSTCSIFLFFEDVILQALKETAVQFKRQSQSLRQVRGYTTVSL